MRFMQHPEGYAAEHQLFHPAVAVGGNDDQIQLLSRDFVFTLMPSEASWAVTPARYVLDSMKIFSLIELISMGPGYNSSCPGIGTLTTLRRVTSPTASTFYHVFDMRQEAVF